MGLGRDRPGHPFGDGVGSSPSLEKCVTASDGILDLGSVG